MTRGRLRRGARSRRAAAPSRDEIARWVHSTDELPLAELLRAHGVAALEDPAQRAQELGLRVAEAGGSVQVKMVLRGGAAEQAGFAAERRMDRRRAAAAKGRAAQGWRIAKLDDLALYLGAAQEDAPRWSRATGALLRLPLTLPTGVTTWRLAAQDPAKIARWLAPQ